jgi:DNA polymerase
MSDHLTPEDLARHARRHLEGLRAAGIEWLPDGSPPAPPAAAAVSLPVVSAEAQPSLWGLDALPPASGAMTREERQQALAALARRVAQCARCAELASTRTQTVFGVGPLDPELCFVGEAPGADEDRLGQPFVGAAGQLLDRIVAACGMKREEVFICNILRCRPPGNRQPQPDEAAHCREYLDATLELVRPKFICALGAIAVKYLLNTAQGITRLRGRFLEYRGIPVMPTYHPAYLLRNPAGKKDVWEDMKKLLARMGKPVPGAK